MHNINGPCQCPRCHQQLIPLLAKGGKSPGCYYIRCNDCKYHYTFMPHLIPDSQPTTSHSESSQVIQQTPSLLPSSRKRSTICSSVNCARPANRLCIRQKCKKCCEVQLGCNVPSHMPNSVSYQPQDISPVIDMSPPFFGLQLPVPLSEQLPIARGWDALTVLIDESPTVQLIRADEARKRDEENLCRQEQILEEQEEAHFQAALRASVSLSPSPSPSPSLPPPLISATSTMSSLSAQPPNVVPAPLATSSKSLAIPKRPTKSTHLDAKWYRKYQDRSKEPMKRMGSAQGDIDVIRKFFIMFWRENGVAAEVFSVQVGDTWPKWTLGGCPATQAKLGSTLIDVYNTHHSHWIQVDDTYPHILSTDQYILLRSRNVTCLDFDRRLAALAKKPTHLRLNMPGERSSVQVSRKRKATTSSPPATSSPTSDNDNVLDLTTPKSSRLLSPKTSRLLSPSRSNEVLDLSTTPTPPPCPLMSILLPKPILTPRSMSASPFSILGSSVSSGISTGTASSTKPLPFDRSALSSPSPLSLPHSRHSEHRQISSKKWPANMYVVDMVAGFLELDVPEHQSLDLTERLEVVFGRPIPRRTYHNQRERWRNATEVQRQRALAFGRTPAGLWSSFAHTLPLK